MQKENPSAVRTCGLMVVTKNMGVGALV